MTKSFEFGNGPRLDKLSSMVAKEVKRVLAQHQEVMKERSSISSHMGTGTAADLLSATPNKPFMTI